MDWKCSCYRHSGLGTSGTAKHLSYMTLKKKIGWTAGILLVLIVGICIGGSLYLIDFSLRRKTGERIWRNLKRSCELNIRRLSPGWTAATAPPCGIRLSPHRTASGCMRFMHVLLALPDVLHHRTRIYGQCHPHVPHRLPL